MNISYKWLKEYVDFDLSAEEVAAALTSIGLEVEGVEEVQSIRGGLQGLVVGQVLTCEPHPNSDHMHITTVDEGLWCTQCGCRTEGNCGTVGLQTLRWRQRICYKEVKTAWH